jgi:hypothetical protein
MDSSFGIIDMKSSTKHTETSCGIRDISLKVLNYLSSIRQRLNFLIP